MTASRRRLLALVALALAFVLAHPAGSALAGTRGPATPPTGSVVANVATVTATRAAARSDLTPEQQEAAKAELTAPKAIVLGVVEGVTEFLPISSTGHLLITERVLDIGQDPLTEKAAETYAIVIQAGAILAILFLYWRRVLAMGQGLIGRDPEGRKVGLAVIIAFLPAAVVGFLLDDTIKAHLLSAWPVIIAWAIGGALLLWFGTGTHDRDERNARPLELIDLRQALIIGVAQCLALWPGTSRSLVTIAAALLVGLSLSAAVEFSFLLGLITLGAATVYEGAKSGGALIDTFGLVNPLIGFVAAFVSAAVAVKWMVTYLQRHSLSIFGWYRLGMAALAAVLVVTGVI